MNLDNLFRAFHLFGVILWIGGLLMLTFFLTAVQAETDAAAKKRLAAFARKLGRVPDVGFTIALVFGLHILVKFKLYTVHYMHAKLLFVAFLIGMHGFLRVKSKRALESGDVKLPAFVRPLLLLFVLAILVFVMTKVPA